MQLIAVKFSFLQVWYVECFTGIFACNAAFSLLLLLLYYQINPHPDVDAMEEARQFVCT